MNNKINNQNIINILNVKFYNKIWVKSFFINILFLVILLSLVFYFILNEQNKRLTAQLQQSTINSAEFLAQQLALSIYVWDKQSIADKINIFFSNLSDVNAVSYCIVHSKKFNEKLFFGPEAKLVENHPEIKPVLEKNVENTRHFQIDNYFHVVQKVNYQSELLKWTSLPDEMLALSPFDSQPIKQQKIEKENISPVVGDIHIGVKYYSVEKALNESINYVLYLSFPILIVALIFHYMQSRIITHQLYNLTEQAKKISAGNYQQFDVKIRSTDEVGILANSFKEMVQKLIFTQNEIKLRNKELEETNLLLDEALQRIQYFNVELEKKVADRTSQLEQLNLTLQKKNAELKEANDTKSKFLSMMSHELRTPLNAIIGFSQLALKRIKDPSYRDFFSEIKQNGDHLLTLINDLLDFSKLEAGQFELLFEDFNLNKTVNEVVSATHALIGTKKIDIRSSISNSENIVYGDPMRVKQVLFNLASNSAKFTQEGNIEFTVKFLSDDTVLPFEIPKKFYEHTFMVIVKDTGIGIAEKDTKAVFEPFKQVDSSESRIHGTGLGLAITKSLIELHHSKIFIKSKENEGTSIYFFIPCTKNDYDTLAKDD